MAPLLKAVSLKEIERIFAVLDAIGVSREAVVIPLRPERPGRLRLLPDGKLEIVVDGDFEAWVGSLKERILALLDRPPG